MDDTTILLVPGSLRAGAHTTALLRSAGSMFPPGFTIREIDAVRPLPHYDADLDGDAAPQIVLDARSVIAEASGLVISTPEYNGTIPGGLKNWVDWVTRPARAHVLVGKPVAVLGASPNGKGAIRAVTWLSDTLSALGAIVVSPSLAIADVVGKIGPDGVVDPATVDELGQLVAALVTQVGGGDGGARDAATRS